MQTGRGGGWPDAAGGPGSGPGRTCGTCRPLAEPIRPSRRSHSSVSTACVRRSARTGPAGCWRALGVAARAGRARRRGVRSSSRQPVFELFRSAGVPVRAASGMEISAESCGAGVVCRLDQLFLLGGFAAGCRPAGGARCRAVLQLLLQALALVGRQQCGERRRPGRRRGLAARAACQAGPMARDHARFFCWSARLCFQLRWRRPCSAASCGGQVGNDPLCALSQGRDGIVAGSPVTSTTSWFRCISCQRFSQRDSATGQCLSIGGFAARPAGG